NPALRSAWLRPAVSCAVNPEPSPVWFVPFDILPEHPLAPTEPACSSNRGKKRPQCQHDWDFASRNSQRYRAAIDRIRKTQAAALGLLVMRSPGPIQPRHVERTHLSPRLVTQPIQKRLEKASKLFFPIRRPANHGRPLQKPTTHESQKN